MISASQWVLIIWAIYWVGAIVSATKARMRVKKVQSGETTFDRLVQHVLMASACYLIFSPYIGLLSARIIPEYLLLSILGCAVVMGSLTLAEWARYTLGRSWSSAVQSVKNQQLIQSEPYKFIRHPIYTGIMGAFLGTFIVQGSYASLIAFVCIMVKYALKIGKEERFLTKLFGPKYVRYKQKTWAVLPFIY